MIEHASSVAMQQPNPADGVRFAPAPDVDAPLMAGDGRPFFQLDIGRAIQLHRKLLLLFALLGVLAAAGYVLWVWPVYTAESHVYVQPASSAVMQRGGEQHWPYDSNTYDSFLQQQVQNATNPAVLMDTLHKIDAAAWMKPGESEDGAAGRLGKAVEVARLGTSYEISITTRAHSPQLAAQIANGMAASLVDHASSQQNAGDAQRLAILRDERNRVQQQLNADLAEQAALNQQLGIASVSANSPALIDSAIVTTRDELIKARTEHDQAAARFASLDASKRASAAALQAEADEIISADPGLNAMKSSLYQRRAALISLMANLTADNPAYKQNAEELSKTNALLDSMMADLRSKAAMRIQEKLRADLERTAGVEAQLSGQLRQLSATAAGSTPKLQRAEDLASDIQRLRTRYASVDEEFHNLTLKDSIPGAIHLSVAAVPPADPTISGVARKALPLAAGGLLLGLLVVLVANNLDQKIYIAEDVQRVLGAAPTVSLPSLAEVSDVVFDEYVLRLSAVIERTFKHTELRNCVFTGVDSGDGVSTVAKRTRILLEDIGQKAILVDAMAAHPAQAQDVAGSGANGEPAAVRGSRSTTLLKKIKEEMRAHPDCVVLTDAAPLAVSAETEFLVRSADCVIVVLQSGVTTRAQLHTVAQTLQRMNIPAAGFVLNNVKSAKADRSFRESLAAVERHLHAPRRTSTRPAHTLFSTADSLPAPQESEAVSVPAPSRAPGEAALPAPAGLRSGAPRWQDEVPLRPVAAREETLVARPSARPAADVFTGFPPPPASFEEDQPQSAEAARERSSRLDGLRGILFREGLKSLNRGRVDEEEAAQPMPAPAPQAAAPPPVAAPAQAAPHAEVAFTPRVREVLATPEFLPPREFIPVRGSEKGGEEENDVRRDRRDPYDPVDILPSWRGQYRRKS